MPNFSYKAREETGKLITGTMEASSKEALALKLQKQRQTVISINEKIETFSAIDKWLIGTTKIKINDLILFNTQLSNMIGAGISLPTSIQTITDQIENPRLKLAVQDVYETIKSGATLSDALGKHKDIFPNIYINMIRAGEVAGNLDEILNRLAKLFEREADLSAKMSTAMFYPIILITLGIVVMIAIIVSVLPAFAKIFIDAKVPLPLPTMVLYNINLFVRAYWKQLIIGLGLFYGAFAWWKKTPTGKVIMDTVMLKVPVYGVLTRESAIARLTRTLGSLITSGVPMLQALEVTMDTVDNAVISKVIKSVIASVSKGETISGPLKASGEFPLMPVHMIAVGEETGALDVMLGKVADFYDISTENSIKKVTALIEPIALVFIGSGVGFIFASILMPIFGMVKTLHS
jgi:type IV pilus assembly protein PilC